jgi:hypothetical protein
MHFDFACEDDDEDGAFWESYVRVVYGKGKWGERWLTQRRGKLVCDCVCRALLDNTSGSSTSAKMSWRQLLRQRLSLPSFLRLSDNYTLFSPGTSSLLSERNPSCWYPVVGRALRSIRIVTTFHIIQLHYYYKHEIFTNVHQNCNCQFQQRLLVSGLVTVKQKRR